MNITYWYFKESGLTREQAESRVLSIGFTDAEKGWEKKLYQDGRTKRFRRLHIIPGIDYFSIHEDTMHHSVHRGKHAKKRREDVLHQLQNPELISK
jgi:hypothetical protein